MNFTVWSKTTQQLPGRIVLSLPKRWSRRRPRQKCSMMWKISTGFSMLPISGSSVMMRSMSTLAWMKSPSVLRRTVPLMPMRQCSCRHTELSPVTPTAVPGEHKGQQGQLQAHSTPIGEKSLKQELEQKSWSHKRSQLRTKQSSTLSRSLINSTMRW